MGWTLDSIPKWFLFHRRDMRHPQTPWLAAISFPWLSRWQDDEIDSSWFLPSCFPELPESFEGMALDHAPRIVYWTSQASSRLWIWRTSAKVDYPMWLVQIDVLKWAFWILDEGMKVLHYDMADPCSASPPCTGVLGNTRHGRICFHLECSLLCQDSSKPQYSSRSWNRFRHILVSCQLGF